MTHKQLLPYRLRLLPLLRFRLSAWGFVESPMPCIFVLTMALRRKLMVSLISAFLSFALTPGSAVHAPISSYLPKEDDRDMEVDAASSGIQSPGEHLLPAIEIYCYLLVLIFLIDQKKYGEAKACSMASIGRMKNLNKRTIDVLASRLCFYFSLSYELTGDLAEIRGNLLNRH